MNYVRFSIVWEGRKKRGEIAEGREGVTEERFLTGGCEKRKFG